MLVTARANLNLPFLVPRRSAVVFRRTHLTHTQPSSPQLAQDAGPRSLGVPLGLPTAQNTSNLVRLLESTMQAGVGDVCSTLWSKDGQLWNQNDAGEWHATAAAAAAAASINTNTARPQRLVSLEFSDSRTALAQLVDETESIHYILSLMKLDLPKKDLQTFVPHDGWTIVRQVTSSTSSKAPSSSYSKLEERLHAYLDIEHGGGDADCERATSLFHPQASLLSVGTLSDEEEPNEWSAPVGNLLEIPLATYLQGVQQQEPHVKAAQEHDGIVNLCLCDDNVACATVRVGNGAQSRTFVDHLLLGKTASSNEWKILSKIFSPQPFPTAAASN